jgi:hypothetical protein
MSVLIVALLGVILAIIPAKVAELEQHKTFGKVWKWGISGFLVLVGVTGFLQGRADKKVFQTQISQLTSQVTIEATKTDIEKLGNKMDEGFGRVVDAIAELRAAILHKSPPKATTTTVTPPTIVPSVQHLHFSERRVTSDNPASPYALQVVIQTDVTVDSPRLLLRFSGAIDEGDFFLAGSALTMMHRTQISNPRIALRLGFDFPSWKPESPIVVTVKSKQEVHLTEVSNTQF